MPQDKKSTEESPSQILSFSVESKRRQLALFDEIYHSIFIETIRKKFESLDSEQEKLKWVNSLEVKISGVSLDSNTFNFQFRADELAVFFNDTVFLEKIRALAGHEFRSQIVEAYTLSAHLGMKERKPLTNLQELHHYIKLVGNTGNKFLSGKNLTLIFSLISSVHCRLANASRDFKEDFKENNLRALKETLNLMHDFGWRASLNPASIQTVEDYTDSVFYVLSAYLPIEDTRHYLEKEFSEPLRGEWFSQLKTMTSESALYSLMNSCYRQGIAGELPAQKYTQFLQIILLLIRQGSDFFENDSILLSMIPGDLPSDMKIAFLFDCRAIKQGDGESPAITQFYTVINFLREFHQGQLGDENAAISLIDNAVRLLDANQLAFFSELFHEIYIHRGLHRTNNASASQSATSILCYLLEKMKETSLSTYSVISICKMLYLPASEVHLQRLNGKDIENRTKIGKMIGLIVESLSEAQIAAVRDGYETHLNKYSYCHTLDLHRYMLTRHSVYSRYDFLLLRKYLNAYNVFAELKCTNDDLGDGAHLGICSHSQTRYLQEIEGNLFLSALVNRDLDSAYDFLRMGVSDMVFPRNISWSDSCFDQYTLASTLISVFFSLVEKQDKGSLFTLINIINQLIVTNKLISLEEVLSHLKIHHLQKSIAFYRRQGSVLQERNYLDAIFALFSKIAPLLESDETLSQQSILPYFDYARKSLYLENAGEGSDNPIILCNLLIRTDPRLIAYHSRNEMSFAFYLLQNLLNKKIKPPENFMGHLIDLFCDATENLTRNEFEDLLNESHGHTHFKQLILDPAFSDLMLDICRVLVSPSGIYEEEVPAYILDFLALNVALSKDCLCDIALNQLNKLAVFCHEAKFRNEASFTQALNIIEKIISLIPEEKQELLDDELIQTIRDGLTSYPPIKKALPSKAKSKNQFETLRLGPRFLSQFNQFLQRILTSQKSDSTPTCATDSALETPLVPENKEEAPIIPAALSLLGSLPESISHAGSAVAAASSDASNRVEHSVYKVVIPRISNIARHRRISDIKFIGSADVLDVIRLIKDPTSEEELIAMPLRESIKLLNSLIRRKDLSERLAQKEIQKLVFASLHEEKIS